MTLLTKFRSVAGPGLLEQAESALERIGSQVPAAVRRQVGIAAAEILANIVEHGGRGGRPANVEVEISVGPGKLQIEVTDDGDEPDVNLDAVHMPDWTAERGRGLAMAKSAVAELIYRRVGSSNSWTVVSKAF